MEKEKRLEVYNKFSVLIENLEKAKMSGQASDVKILKRRFWEEEKLDKKDINYMNDLFNDAVV